MKKKYIVWWVISAVCLWMDYRNFVYGWYSPVFLFFTTLIGAVCLYVGFRRWNEYREYIEDRKIRNEYMKSQTRENTEVKHDGL